MRVVTRSACCGNKQLQTTPVVMCRSVWSGEHFPRSQSGLDGSRLRCGTAFPYGMGGRYGRCRGGDRCGVRGGAPGVGPQPLDRQRDPRCARDEPAPASSGSARRDRARGQASTALCRRPVGASTVAARTGGARRTRARCRRSHRGDHFRRYPGARPVARRVARARAVGGDRLLDLRRVRRGRDGARRRMGTRRTPAWRWRW